LNVSERVVANILYHKCGDSEEVKNNAVSSILDSDLYSLNQILNLLIFITKGSLFNKGSHITNILSNDEIHQFIITVNIMKKTGHLRSMKL